jgi:DNA-directed RNA polymerase specialized sigma24 family protein
VRTDEERERDANLRDALEAVDWADASARLTATARRMMGQRGNLADAKDLAQEAMSRVFDPDYKAWNPHEKTIQEHLASVVWGLLCNRHANKGENSTDALDSVEHKKLPPDPRSLERELEMRQIKERVFAGLRERFAGRKLERELVELFEEGVDLPREQVQELGLPYAKVYRARSRVMDEARRILASLDEAPSSPKPWALSSPELESDYEED